MVIKTLDLYPDPQGPKMLDLDPQHCLKSLKTYTQLMPYKLFSVMVSNQDLLANKEGPLSTTICSQTTEESKGNRNVRYSPTEAAGEAAKIYYSPAEREMGLKVDSNEKNEGGSGS